MLINFLIKFFKLIFQIPWFYFFVLGLDRSVGKIDDTSNYSDLAWLSVVNELAKSFFA